MVLDEDLCLLPGIGGKLLAMLQIADCAISPEQPLSLPWASSTCPDPSDQILRSDSPCQIGLHLHWSNCYSPQVVMSVG